MSSTIDQEALAKVCPHLGLADDADSHATYATEAHRCFRLERATRIATNHQDSYCLGADHVNCPIFRGEGIAATQTAPAVTQAARGRPAEPAQPKTPRLGGSSGGGASRPARPAAAAAGAAGSGMGTVGPRPRAGGVSIPTLTIGLLVLAAVVVGLALWLQSLLAGDDDDDAQASNTQATQTALARTPTRAAATATITPGGPTLTPTPRGNTAPTPTITPGGPTLTPTPRTGGSGANTYTVKAGDNCGAIAEANATTFEELRRLNPEIDADCTNLQEGQIIKLR